jgi:hypothetical protein
MEAGGVGGLEQACESQLQAAMHPTYVAALNTPPGQCLGSVTLRYGTDPDPRIRTKKWITDPAPALF